MDDFLVDLEDLVLTCGYENTDRHVRDRFIAGIRDPHIQKKLQFMMDADLAKAVSYAVSYPMK